jgi:polygalacturonase
MQEFRREFLRMAGLGVAGGATTLVRPLAAQSQPGRGASGSRDVYFNVRGYGAKGDGNSIDSPAINAAIDAAANVGGGTVVFPAGTYASYSIRLKSNVALYLQQGATILAAPTLNGKGYDAQEPQNPAWEAFQDYGHNHWHNSLIWGENLHDIGIFGPGLIWGKGLGRGDKAEMGLPASAAPGAGNKSVALKNCHNVILSDFSILQGGWFGILATGVDNLTINNLKVDTNRDGIDVDCCRNVRISNCTVNSPYDDGICPKSSFSLGYARATENVTITGCYVTGGYQVGTVLDGTWKPHVDPPRFFGHGRIKCGTESNGGFLNITISDCVFDKCRGFALETADGARLEDITFTGIAMRGVRGAPLFLRLESRMRGPKDAVPGTLKRVLMSNITSHDADPMPSIIAGIPGHNVEDIKLSDCYFGSTGYGKVAAAAPAIGASTAVARTGFGEALPGLATSSATIPPEVETGYPEPTMFGDLDASGLFARHVRNLELSNIEFATDTADSRPACWLVDIDGADLFRLKLPHRAQKGQFLLHNVRDFRVFGCQHYKDTSLSSVEDQLV